MLNHPATGFYRELRQRSGQDLDPKSVKTSRFFESAMTGTEVHQSIISELILTVPTETRPGTTGEYLYGCFTPQAEVEISCTPSCIRGFKLPEHKSCDYPVWERTATGFTKINDKVGSHAYVYAEAPLSNQEMQTLRVSGVKQVSFYAIESSTIRYRKGPVLEIIEPVVPILESSDECEDEDEPEIVEQENHMWWILVLIFLIILIVIAAWLLMKKSTKTEM